MAEDQKSELLKQIRNEVKKCIKLIEESLSSATECDTITIENSSISRNELVCLKQTLEKASTARSRNTMEKLLLDDTIPFELFMENDSWDTLQRLIFILHDEL